MPVSIEHKERVLKHCTDAACKKAESAIQQILIDLSFETEREIEAVNVDTREFADLKVEIFFEDQSEGCRR